MLSVSEALTRVLSNFNPLSPEQINLEHSVGRVLAETIISSVDLPNFANSSMDGYAVIAQDVRHATRNTPVTLKVIGDIPAGSNPIFKIESGTAARILTGAKIPDGCDAVVPVEATDQAQTTFGGGIPDQVSVFEPTSAGGYIRIAGEDVHINDTIFEAGKFIRPYDVGVLAALGKQYVQVVRRPRVVIFSTGDELVTIDRTPREGQVRDINTHVLSALIKKYGGDVLSLGLVSDDLDAVHRVLINAVEQKADVIISSAGVSVGVYDVVKSAVEREGGLNFWRVNMRPGKPVAYGNVRNIPFFGLPGNPVSAIVGFELFVRPALLKLGGHARWQKPTVEAITSESLSSDGRETYLRAIVTREGNRYYARSAGGQGSNIISAFTRANALVILPSGVKKIEAGASITAWMLDWTEDSQ